MKFTFLHHCTHSLDKQKTIAFYERALGMRVVREKGPEDGSWTITFLESETSPFQIEITWNRGRTEPYDNGDGDTHIAFEVDDYEAAHALHESMGCIVHENPSMGLYFIADPDGCWIEILPPRD